MSERAFDYVIVGAGSAGCVLANRLSADPSVNVALLEAGGVDSRREIRIPAAFSRLFRGDCDWAYFTEPQANLDGRRIYWPRGKVLGGSSSINAMIYTRGNQRDFDEWEALGNPGWGHADVSGRFRRAENRPFSATNEAGPLEISALRSPNPLSLAFVDACVETGIPRNGDFNEGEQDGAGLFHVTQRAGERHSAAAAYLAPARSRPNLTVITGAHATRVVVERGRAVGVEYRHGGALHVVRSGREVLLAGGALNSPQLLMLSGIGDPDHLRSVGIEPVVPLPGVGSNLQDHLVTAAVYRATRPVSLAAAESIGTLLKYLLFRRGMLTSNVAEAGAFIRMKGGDVPDIELIFGASFYMNHGFDNPEGHGFTVGAILMHPGSRGTVRLGSADPFAAPLIDPKYLDDPGDLVMLREATRVCRRIGGARAFDAWRGDEVWPGAENQSDDEIDAFIRSHAETLYHPAGTCRMGSDEDAVVDPELRVRGLTGLRVIDASVMPTIITGHPNAAVIMIAERGAELVRGARS